jgi:hypothetical protein
VDQLQKVALERCGVLREELAAEVLLAAEGDDPSKGEETLRIKGH